MFNYLLFNLN